MSIPSPTDTDPLTVELFNYGALSASTAPSSVTSEFTYPNGSPSLGPLDDFPTPKIRLARLADGEDERLASREPVAPVPSDFPGKKLNRSAHIVEKGDFESDRHFYARCCMTRLPCVLIFSSARRASYSLMGEGATCTC